MKKKSKTKKLTPQNYKDMWGERGPYSQVRLCEETRILDDSISRIFLVVEAEINPFTFEYIRKNRSNFLNDMPVLQLLDHAKYRDEYGYVVGAGEVELEDEESRQFARKQTDMVTQALIRMHKFIIEEFCLQKESKFGVITDDVLANKNFVWNEATGRVEMIDEELWGNETLISSPTGIENNKMRFFIVLAFKKSFDFKDKSTIKFAKTLKTISTRLEVEIEDISAFHKYVRITALIPFDIAPAQFIESVLGECVVGKNPIFQKDYFVTNVKKPTQEQIMSFLAQLPLDKDSKMDME